MVNIITRVTRVNIITSFFDPFSIITSNQYLFKLKRTTAEAESSCSLRRVGEPSGQQVKCSQDYRRREKILPIIYQCSEATMRKCLGYFICAVLRKFVLNLKGT